MYSQLGEQRFIPLQNLSIVVTLHHLLDLWLSYPHCPILLAHDIFPRSGKKLCQPPQASHTETQVDKE